MNYPGSIGPIISYTNSHANNAWANIATVTQDSKQYLQFLNDRRALLTDYNAAKSTFVS